MRLKLIFLQDSKVFPVLIEKKMNKMVLPVNLSELKYIKDLKRKISELVNEKVGKCEVQDLFLDGFVLIDEFDISEVLDNNDEVSVAFRNYLPITEKKKQIKTLTLHDNDNTEKKKVTILEDSSSSDNCCNITTNEHKNKSKLITQKRERQTEKDKDKERNESSESESDEMINVKKQKIQSQKIKKSPPKQKNILNMTTNANKQIAPHYYPNITKKTAEIEKQPKQIFTQYILSEKYSQIKPDEIDNIEALQQHYPSLFQRGTSIIFRVHELLKDGPGIGEYKKGKIEEYSADNRSFLISLEEQEMNNNLSTMYDISSDFLCVPIKDIVDVWIEKTNDEEKKDEKCVKDDNHQQPEVEKMGEKEKEKEKENPSTSKLEIDSKEKIVLPFIKKQVEFYFSDKNYYKDKFLLEKASLDKENCKCCYIINLLVIDISIIMGFNKIRIMTKKKDLVIEALKDSKIVEVNEDCCKIRKRNLMKDFMP